MRKATSVIVASTIVSGGLSAFALYAYEPTTDVEGMRAATAFAAFSLFAAVMPYSVTKSASGTATTVPLLACAILVPSWISVVVASCVTLISQIVLRTGAIKTSFNVAQQALAVTAAIVAYRMSGGAAAIHGADIAPVGLLAASIGFFLGNSIAVAAVIGAESNTSMSRVWRETSWHGITNDVLVVPFIYVFARVYIDLGVLAAAATAALLIVVRQLNSTNEELHRSNKELLELTVTTLEARDPYTSGHSRRVSQYSRIFGQALSISAKSSERLTVAALLHDVGKIHEVFAPILAKPGKLTPEERAIMESHPIKGAELVQISSHLRDAVGPIRHHHEAWDGSGYPDALAGESIPYFARIIAIADTIDAMASDRPYRRGLSSLQIRSELLRMSGIQFDPVMLRTLLDAKAIDTVLRLACNHNLDSYAAEPTLSLLSQA